MDTTCLALLLVEEPALVGEIGYEQPSEDTEDDRDQALDGEYPLPAVEDTKALHERKDIGCVALTRMASLRERSRSKNGAGGADHRGSEIKNGKALLNLMTLVPSRDDENKGREKSCLAKDVNKYHESLGPINCPPRRRPRQYGKDEITPGWDESHFELGNTPTDHANCQPVAYTNPSEDNITGKLSSS